MVARTQTQQQKTEVLPSFFCTIASSESHQLISKDELMRIIKFDAMTQNRTELYRKQLPISKTLADGTKIMMPGITASALHQSGFLQRVWRRGRRAGTMEQRFFCPLHLCLYQGAAGEG